MTSSFEFKPNVRLNPFGPTVWHEFTPLANKHSAVNLGQGFPNFSGPSFVMDAAKSAIDQGLNQYALSSGHPRLVKALSKLYSPLFSREIDPTNQIVVTDGASEGIYAAMQGLISPGDEVILIEPFFDIYIGAIAMAGGVPKYVPLKPRSPHITSASELIIDQEDLEKAITDKTRVLLLNNPQNPTGKAFTYQELEMIANVVKRHPHLVVVSDEVYEWLMFDDVPHIRMATLPNMWERCVTISSSGKTFSCTGWKIGWCIGPNNIIAKIACAHQFIPFSVATPFQEAIAVGLETAMNNNFFQEFKKMYQGKRDTLIEGLKNAGLNPITPQGSFFTIVDTSSIKIPDDISQVSLTGNCLDRRDWNVCRYFTTKVGVAAIPISAFYCDEHIHMAPDLVRFAFCKTEENLEEACKRLAKLKELQNKS